MFKLCGILLLRTGCVGFAYSLCREKQRKILLLKEFKYLYARMQNEMQYAKDPFPALFLRLSENVSEPLSGMLQRISRQMSPSQSIGFEEVWQKEAALVLKEYALDELPKNTILRFPAFMSLWECGGQVKALQRQIDELEHMIAELESEEKSKRKMIMSLGVAAGLFLTIILL